MSSLFERDQLGRMLKRFKRLALIILVVGLCGFGGGSSPGSGGGGGGAPSGPAGGDLGGSYPNPTVVSGGNIGAGTIPNAALVTAPLTAASSLNASNITSGSLAGARVSGWPLTGFSHFLTGNANTFNNTANQTQAMLFHLPAPVTFSKIGWDVTTGDGTNHYDICIYNSTGATLLANLTGSGTGIHMGSTGAQVFSTTQGSQTIGPGMFVIAYTGDSTTMKFEGSTLSMSLSFQANVGATTNGACASSITLGAIAPSVNDFAFVLE